MHGRQLPRSGAERGGPPLRSSTWRRGDRQRRDVEARRPPGRDPVQRSGPGKPEEHPRAGSHPPGLLGARRADHQSLGADVLRQARPDARLEARPRRRPACRRDGRGQLCTSRPATTEGSNAAPTATVPTTASWDQAGAGGDRAGRQRRTRRDRARGDLEGLRSCRRCPSRTAVQTAVCLPAERCAGSLGDLLVPERRRPQSGVPTPSSAATPNIERNTGQAATRSSGAASSSGCTAATSPAGGRSATSTATTPSSSGTTSVSASSTHRDVLITAREGGSDHVSLTRWWRPWHHLIGKAQ